MSLEIPIKLSNSRYVFLHTISPQNINKSVFDKDFPSLPLFFLTKTSRDIGRKIKLLHTSHKSMLTSRHKNASENRYLLRNDQRLLF